MPQNINESRIILAGDIGGTHSRLALYYAGQKGHRLIQSRTFLNRAYTKPEMIFREFLRGRKVTSACFGVAGPVTNGQIKITNLPWLMDVRSIKRELSAKRVEIINDLVANAYGIFLLKRKDFQTLNAGKKQEGNAGLLSAGTGLGAAILFWDGKKYVPCPSEGGHVEFGPTNPLEIEILQSLQDRFGHVSYERVLSGEGLSHIYEFLRDRKRLGREPRWIRERMNQEDPAAVISETAKQGANTLCAKALDLFASIYGSAAANLALFCLALGGIYIGGGIAPKIAWKLRDGTFMTAFKKKGRLSEIVANIPVKIVMNDKAALMGAAYYIQVSQS